MPYLRILSIMERKTYSRRIYEKWSAIVIKKYFYVASRTVTRDLPGLFILPIRTSVLLLLQ